MAGHPVVPDCPDDVPQRKLVARDKWPKLATCLTSVWGPEDPATAKILVCSGCDQWQVYEHHQLGCLQLEAGLPCKYQAALEGLNSTSCPLGKWAAKENEHGH